MRQKLYILLACLVILPLAGCGIAPVAADSSTVELIAKIEALEKQVDELQSENNRLVTENAKAISGNEQTTDVEKPPAPELESETEPETGNNSEPEPAPDVVVTFTGKKNIQTDVRNGIYSDRVEFSIEVKNNTDSEIRGIQGVADIQDMFGISILKLNCDLVGETLLAGDVAYYNNLGIDVNQFIDSNVKVYTTDYNDLKFVYTVNQIVFADS